jgi:hypothetical protein
LRIRIIAISPWRGKTFRAESSLQRRQFMQRFIASVIVVIALLGAGVVAPSLVTTAYADGGAD